MGRRFESCQARTLSRLRRSSRSAGSGQRGSRPLPLESRCVRILPIWIVGRVRSLGRWQGRCNMPQVSAHRDSLIDLSNRRFVLHEIERHVKRYRRHRRPYSLLVVDIHDMAWLDSTFGQTIADAALGDLADLISANVREVDAWFLSTRDQFIIVMDETDAHAAQTVAATSCRRSRERQVHAQPGRRSSKGDLQHRLMSRRRYRGGRTPAGGGVPPRRHFTLTRLVLQ